MQGKLNQADKLSYLLIKFISSTFINIEQFNLRLWGK